MENLSTIGDSIRDLQLSQSDIRLAIMNTEKELQETEAYKKLQSYKKQESDLNCLIETRKQHVLEWMQNAGIKSIEFIHQKMTLKKSPGAVKIEDEEMIPGDYKKEKVTITIDKTKIKNDIKDWKQVNGATIEFKDTLLITPK